MAKTTRTSPQKFCVILSKDNHGGDTRDGLHGNYYWIAAEWSYYGDSVGSVMERTPEWLATTVGTTCPHVSWDGESWCWIPDTEIDALKAKADFVAEEGVTIADSRWDTKGEEDRLIDEADDDEAEQEYNANIFATMQFLNTIKSGTLILMCMGKTCFGYEFVIGHYQGQEYKEYVYPFGDKTEDKYIHAILKDPITVIPDNIVAGSIHTDIKRISGTESFMVGEFNENPSKQIVQIKDPSVDREAALKMLMKIQPSTTATVISL
jgi:hypothetical protein